jgi:uncharacterized protein
MADDIDGPCGLTLTTGDGNTLDAEVITVPGALGAAVVCHPHPQMGGDRHNPVVDALFRALPRHEITTLRFDFRGVGRSTGAYADGIGERQDAEAALTWLAEHHPGMPLWSVGYSFGGDVALSVDHPALAGWVAVAPPLRVLADDPPASTSGRPTTLVVPAHDQFSPPERTRAETAAWHDTSIVEVPMGDHFLAGRLDTVADLVLAALGQA